MLLRSLTLSLMVMAYATASPIDSGFINLSGALPQTFSFTSGFGNYSINGQLGGSFVVQHDSCFCHFEFPIGAVVALTIFSPLDGAIGSGSGTVGGVFYPSLSFVAFFDPMTTKTDPFTIAGGGTYVVPFTIEGSITASLGAFQTVLSDQFTGAGLATFFVARSGENSFDVRQATFTLTPEPSSFFLLSGGLFILLGSTSLHRNRLRHPAAPPQNPQTRQEIEAAIEGGYQSD